MCKHVAARTRERETKEKSVNAKAIDWKSEGESMNDVRKKYRHEICKITNMLNKLSKERVYEKSHYKRDGYLKTNIEQLREIVDDLLDKVEGDLDSDKSPEKREKYTI